MDKIHIKDLEDNWISWSNTRKKSFRSKIVFNFELMLIFRQLEKTSDLTQRRVHHEICSKGRKENLKHLMLMKSS